MYVTSIDNEFLTNQLIASYHAANEDIFKFKLIRPGVVDWVEETIYLPRSSSDYSGKFSYDMTPYWREPVSHSHPGSPVRTVSIMKCVQSGATESVIIPAICYSIAEDPCSILLTAGDLTLAKDTIEKRLDPVLLESQLNHLLRPHVTKKTNNKSGDTADSKEFIGGSLYARGTQSATVFRQFPAKKVFADDFDAAPRQLGKEGSTRGLIEGRQNSFGERAKAYYISTPTIQQTSNIYELFMLGTQKHWHWLCKHCGVYMPVQFKIEREDGNIAGIVYNLDGKGRLVTGSVAYMCPHCSQLSQEKQKYELNHNGIWVAGTDEPVERHHESYQFNGLALPAGFTGWVKIVEEFLQAAPPGQKSDPEKLKTLNNLRFGLPFVQAGAVPRVNELMKNTKGYFPGVIPDLTSEQAGTGKIVMLTLACDLNGIVEEGNEDVRLDWELVAHTATGVTYSVDHGSIGTFKRKVHRTKQDEANEPERVKWTSVHNVENSIWKEFEAIVKKDWPLESAMIKPKTSGETAESLTMQTTITVVDTGHGEKVAMLFVQKMQEEQIMCFGVKGRIEQNYRKIIRESWPVRRSPERPRQLYLIEVDQIKDDLSENMKLRAGSDGSQPSGFMNFPEPRDGKYTMSSFFMQYESEKRTEELNNAKEIIGYKWVKKNSDVQNHFWDVRVYNLAAPFIFIDFLKQSNPTKYKNFGWEEFVIVMTT